MALRQPVPRAVSAITLGALSYLLLPVPGRFGEGFGSVVLGSLVARAVVAACVVGLVGVTLPRRVAAASLTAAVVAGFLLRALLTPIYFQPLGLLVGVLVGLVASYAVGALASVEKWHGAAEVIAVAVVLVVALWFAGVLPGPLASSRQADRRQAALTAPAPRPEQYRYDALDYVRTYYLMKEGVGYYDAYRMGVTQDARHDESFMTSPFMYREPLVFEIWRVLPGSTAYALFLWFVMWGLGTMVAAYLLASAVVEPGVALLAPIALLDWLFFFWWTQFAFVFTEVWAVGLGVAAVAALVRRQRVLSLVFLVLAVAARELTVVLIPAWIVVWWVSGQKARRSSWWFPATAVLAPAIVLTVHIASVPQLSPGGGIDAWFHGGPDALIAALRYGWTPLSSGFPQTTWLPLAIVAFAIAAAALSRPRWRTAGLVCASVLPVVFLLTFSGGQWHYYWGAIYTPLAVALAPGVLGRLMPPHSSRAVERRRPAASRRVA